VVCPDATHSELRHIAIPSCMAARIQDGQYNKIFDVLQKCVSACMGIIVNPKLYPYLRRY
jgi:hypothetical protein